MALSDTAIRRAAALIARGRFEPAQPIGTLPADCSPADVRDAMAVQDALHALFTEGNLGRVVGTKIGCTTGVMQRYLGMLHPCAGGILDRTIHEGTGEFAHDRFLHVGVECEIAVTLGGTLAAADGPFDRDGVAEAVATVHAAIEVVDDRYVDFETRNPDWRTWVADDFFGAGLVLGEANADWASLDLAAIGGRMTINGRDVGHGHGRDIVNGHPLEALVWLANFESARGRDLPAGWIVSLGSVVRTHWLDAGDEVTVALDGLGEATARFV